MPKAAAETIEVAGITLTHPDRVLWPEQGVTKRALAEFYAGIADRILPHVVNRPLTLVRCPSGSDGACFVQKHPWAGLHQAVRRVRDGGEEWLAVDDVTGLVALVQMGVLELHPWGATADDLERPDRIVFDLDPDEGVPWAHVVEGARAVHAALDDLGLRGFVKATGGKGLHVVVPVEPHADWETAKAFARGRGGAACGGPARALHDQPAEGGKERPHFPGPPAQQPRRHRGGRLLDPRAAWSAGGDAAGMGSAGRCPRRAPVRHGRLTGRRSVEGLL